MPTLAELDAHFVRYAKGTAGKGHGRPLPGGGIKWGGFEVNVIRRVKNFADAQGVWFLCPLCFAKNGGAVGTHSCEVTFEGRGAKDDEGSHGTNGQPTRWTASGTGLHDLVCTPSILLTPPGCAWHGFIGSSGVPPGHAA